MKRTHTIVVFAITTSLLGSALAVAAYATPQHYTARNIALDLRRGNDTHYPLPSDIAAAMGIEIVWTDAPCGLDASGCFDPAKPWQIEARRYGDRFWDDSTILHELGHVQQYEAGLPFDECDADARSIALGAKYSTYNCPGMLDYSAWSAGSK